MKQIFKNGDMKIPAKIWSDDVDQNTLQQIRTVCEMPYVHKHMAVMPDAHLGYGVCIGGVVATKDVIVANFVGVDIGCGVASCKLDIPTSEIDRSTFRDIITRIKEEIPVGKNHHKVAQSIYSMPVDLCDVKGGIVEQEYDSALKQIGTLGGGNHFIELQRTGSGLLNIMIHSGSRNLGYKVANHYHKVAVKLCEMYHSGIPKDLSFLPIKSDEGQEYLKEMQYCVAFAEKSRSLMMQKVKAILSEFFRDVNPIYFYDIAHNYAAIENHFGENVWVHRKGATKAYKGEIGIIPGSQGSNSYIVRGLGNEESFKSCSHGAGRLMSRSKAKDTLDLKTEQKRLNELGVVHDMRSRSKLDEATSAYKDIKSVMANQKDLVEIVDELTPLAVVKGNEIGEK